MDAPTIAIDLARGSIVLGAALAAMPLLRGAKASTRRALLLAAFAVATLAPIAPRLVERTAAAPYVSLPVVVRAVPVEPLVDDGAIAATTAAAHAGARRVDETSALPWIALAAWAVGAALVGARLLRALAKARGLVARSDAAAAAPLAGEVEAAYEIAGLRARVAVSDEIDAPAVAGLRRPVVLLPRAALGWNGARLRVALLHELAHVRRRDCAAFAAIELAVVVRWFDPLAWLAAARLRRERELAADESVIAAGVLPSAYATELLSIAEPGHLHGAASGALVLGMAARKSELAARVEAIVRSPADLARLASARAMAAAAAIGCAAVAGACAAVPAPPQAEAAAPAPIAASAAPAAGSTIDAQIQAFADEEVERLRREWSAPAATVIVLDPSTGGVLALGSPETARTPYVPGSTFKMIGLAAALDVGAITVDQPLDCGSGSRAYGARTLRDATPYGVLSASEAIAVSSNVCATRVLDAIGAPTLTRYVERFHVPAFAKPGAIDDFDRAIFAIGEGSRAAPLDMAAAYAAVASGGVYHAPSTVRGGAAGDRVISAQTAERVMSVLEGVVRGERATGKRARIDGVRVAGKTGTSEWTGGCCGQAAASEGPGEHRFSSFVGIVPADAPRFVVFVGVLDPKGDAPGGLVAAPAFARVASRALAVR